MTKITKREALESAFYGLSTREPFYANMLAEINILFSARVPTAGLIWDRKREEFSIEINEEFFCSLPFEQRVGVLSHEILHFSNGHMFRSSQDVNNMRLENVAQDMAINQFIPHLPEGCVRVDQFKMDDGTPFPTFKSWEVYYELLKSEQKNNKQMMEKYGQGDEDGKGESEGRGVHRWEDLSEDEKKEMLKNAAGIFKRTIEKSSTGYTKIPDAVKELLEHIEAQVRGINYKKILKDCIKKTISAQDREGTWNRKNKRYGNYAPGTRLGSVPVVHFFIDTSGSISATELNEFLTVVDGFLKVGSKKCKISFWHTALYKTQRYRSGQRFDQNELESGGTDVAPTLEFIKDVHPDLSIILTDGYYERVDTKINSEVIWIIAKNGDNRHVNNHIGKTIPLSGICEKG